MPNSPCRARQGGKLYIGQLFVLPPVDSPFDLQGPSNSSDISMQRAVVVEQIKGGAVSESEARSGSQNSRTHRFDLHKTGMPSSPNPCAQAIQLVLPSAYRSSAGEIPTVLSKTLLAETVTRLGNSPIKNTIHPPPHLPELHQSKPSLSDISGVPNHQGNLEPLKPHAGSPEPQPNLALLSETHPPQDTPRPWVLPKQVEPADQSLTEQRFADKLGVTDFIKPDHPRPAYINEFRDRYLAAIGSESQLKLVEDELKKILGMNQIEYGMGMNWLKAFEGICQTQEDVNSELRMNTLVSFSYRNLMSKLSDPHTVPSPEHEQLHGFIVKLEKDRELYYQGKFWSNVKVGQNRGKNLERKLTMRQVDWSQEALFPYMGLGNTERVKTFKGMIERNPAIERNEAKFIQSLAQTVNRANVETDSQTKTASIVLLLQLKAKGGEGLEGLFEDFSFTNKAQDLAATKIESLLRPENVGSVWSNDKVLLQTLETQESFHLNKLRPGESPKDRKSFFGHLNEPDRPQFLTDGVPVEATRFQRALAKLKRFTRIERSS
ncbi:hypothetical protein Pst134EA_017490 [Puccinia striiformis f. sp. tritici]|uniref:hypothetical protein n=1 Tax=Puccinia striiformis f. sp. tritici TaxID=168172 RepID=UPI002008B21C|nr:hypothetical protein Pst134EA_017490 [Puccinia striiformis f. sp. tritici]KAH9461180.1 hypothetical protein Pst134EA_017490 [Puccinia striiformis f. sp. tritici]